VAIAIFASLTAVAPRAFALDPDSRAPPPPAVAPAVIVLRPPGADEAATEAAARVEGELGAAGFRVVDLPLTEEVRTAIESAGLGGSGLRPIAAFAIVVEPAEDAGGTPVAEIWISDRIRQRTVIQRMSLDAASRPRGAEILAIRSVELLKASLAEYWLPSQAPPPPAPLPPAPAAPPPPPAPPRPERPAVRDAPLSAILGVEIGAGMIATAANPSPVWTPVVKLSHGFGAHLVAGVDLRGFGPPGQLANAEGTAKVDLQVAGVEGMITPWPRAVVVPFACLEAGAQHVRITGTGVAPYSGTTTDTWSAWTAAGAGAAIPIAGWIHGSADVLAALAWPQTGVHIAGADVGRIGGPSIVLDAGLVGTFR
jgi:hypothetical protein